MQSPKHYFALILAPTRELAGQVQAQFVALGKPIGLHTILMVGGTPIAEQSNQMALKPPHVIIGRFAFCLTRLRQSSLNFVLHLKQRRGGLLTT